MERQAMMESAGRSAQLPKSICFDGKGDWQSFITKFHAFADKHRWDSSDRQSNLCWVLEGNASEFFTRILKREPTIDYFVLLQRMERRFDLKDLPETSQMLFSSATQHTTESLVEWADRVMGLAHRAFPDLPDSYMYNQAILRFCQGAADRVAGLQALRMRPQTIDAALDQIRWNQHIIGDPQSKARKEIRSVHYCADEFLDAAENEGYLVRQAQVNSGGKRVHFQKSPESEVAERLTRVEKRLDSLGNQMGVLSVLAKEVAEIKSVCSSFTKQIQNLSELGKWKESSGPVRGRSGSFSPRSKSPVGDRQFSCYSCGETGHIRARCPNSSPKRVNLIYEEEEDLNSSGLEEEA